MIMKSNIIVLLSGNGTTMQSIVETCNNANVVTVVSNKIKIQYKSVKL